MPEEQPGSSDFLPGWDEYRKLSGYDTADGEAGMRDRKSHLGSCKPFIFKWQFIQSEISSTNAQIRALTGHNATLVRPPYGAYNSNVQINAGAPLILWSIDTLDWKTRNAKNTINVVMNEVKDGSIILMHDIHSPSVDAAEVLIPKLIASGYQLVTVSELAKYRSVAMYSGGVYNAFYR